MLLKNYCWLYYHSIGFFEAEEEGVEDAADWYWEEEEEEEEDIKDNFRREQIKGLLDLDAASLTILNAMIEYKKCMNC